MTLQPLIFAICPTADPTAPAAPVTTRVSPALGLQSSRKPKYDVALEGGKGGREGGREGKREGGREEGRDGGR